MAPFFETWICVNLPKRDELRLRLVSAFPNASSSGLVITRSAPSSIDDLDMPASERCLVTYARCFSTSLHVSVLPAPEGPETMMACARGAERSRHRRSNGPPRCRARGLGRRERAWLSPELSSSRYMRSAMA